MSSDLNANGLEYHSDTEVILPFDKAFSVAAGYRMPKDVKKDSNVKNLKELYFSAKNDEFDEAGSYILRQDGATYIHSETSGEKIVRAKVLFPDIKPEQFANEYFTEEPTNFLKARLPIAFVPLEGSQAPFAIADITDKQAHLAGYEKPNQLRVLLALQSEREKETIQLLNEVMNEYFNSLDFTSYLSESGGIERDLHNDNNEVVGQIKVQPPALEVFKQRMVQQAFVVLKRDLSAEKVVQDAPYLPFVKDLVDFVIEEIETKRIPGEASVYHMSVADPDKLAAQEKISADEASQRVASGLKEIHQHIIRPGVGSIDLRETFAAKHLSTGFRAMKDNLSAQISQLGEAAGHASSAADQRDTDAIIR